MSTDKKESLNPKGQKDIVPELLEKIRAEFQEEYDNNELIQAKLERLSQEISDHLDTNEYAEVVADILARILGKNVVIEILPDGKMYYNIADRILNDTLKTNYKLVADYLAETQTNLNHENGYGIKGIRPKFNQDMADGLIDKISSADTFDKGKWVLDDGVRVFTQKVVDAGIKENADLLYQAGIEPIVKRMALYNACKWCRSLAGTYFYNEVKATGNDVWRRHRSCRCYVIDYHPGKKPRNAHTKEYLQEFDEDSQEGSKYEVNKDNRDLGKLGRLVEYKKINVDWNLVSKHTKEKMQERNVLKKDIEKWINEGYLVEQIKDYKYVYVSDDGVVVIDKYGKIITVWSKDFFDENMINKIRKIKRGF